MATIPTYDLTSLIDWTRREGGDRLQSFFEYLSPDGTRRVPIDNDGSISVSYLEVDGSPKVEDTDFTISGNYLVFNASVGASVQVYCEYDQSVYSDDDVVNFIVDGARFVGTDLYLRWTLDTDNSQIIDTYSEMFDDAVDPTMADKMVEKLIVMKSGLLIAQEKAKSAADNAISIKDGDTTIQTSQSATALQRRVDSLEKAYNADLAHTRQNRFVGTTVDWVGMPWMIWPRV